MGTCRWQPQPPCGGQRALSESWVLLAESLPGLRHIPPPWVLSLFTLQSSVAFLLWLNKTPRVESSGVPSRKRVCTTSSFFIFLWHLFIFHYNLLSILFCSGFGCTREGVDKHSLYKVLPRCFQYPPGAIHSYSNVMGHPFLKHTCSPALCAFTQTGWAMVGLAMNSRQSLVQFSGWNSTSGCLSTSYPFWTEASDHCLHRSHTFGQRTRRETLHGI